MVPFPHLDCGGLSFFLPSSPSPPFISLIFDVLSSPMFTSPIFFFMLNLNLMAMLSFAVSRFRSFDFVWQSEKKSERMKNWRDKMAGEVKGRYIFFIQFKNASQMYF